MHLGFVDRGSAHSIWHLLDAVAQAAMAGGHSISYFRMIESGAIAPPSVPDGVRCIDILVGHKQFPWQLWSQLSDFQRTLDVHLRQQPIDLLHTNFCVPGSRARRIAKRQFGIPVVTTCHEMFGSMNPLLRWGVRRTEHDADAIVYISQAVARSYRPHFMADDNGIDRQDGRHRLIYNGIDVAGIEAWVHAARQSPSAPAPDGSARLLSVGRLVPEKGHDRVIRALPELVRHYPQIVYRLLGEGPHRDSLVALARSLGVQQHLQLGGWVSHQQAIQEMVSADVVLMPSLPIQEGFGLALAEAMLCGTPIVCSRIDVFEEVAGDETASLRYFDLARPADLASSIIGLLQGSRFSDDCAAVLPARVRKRFDEHQMAASYVDLYESILGHRGSL